MFDENSEKTAKPITTQAAQQITEHVANQTVGHPAKRRATCAPRLSRRKFLLSSAVMAALATLNLSHVVSPAMAQSSDPADFARLSAFLTGQNALDATSAQRFLASLTKHDAAFPTKAAALLQFIDGGKFANMDALLASIRTDKTDAGSAAVSAAGSTPAATTTAPTAGHPEMMATATSIVSAWYLGIVGAAADAELITYETSLMYTPTKGILAVPTYGPGPLAWGETPPGISQNHVTASQTPA